MQPQISMLTPRKAINKAFLKVKPNRSDIEHFKTNLSQLIDRINDQESEEFHKNLVIDFLKKSYYDPRHFINTKGKNDLVIHNGDKASSSVGVIVEAKKPTNNSEMLSRNNINVKAFQELVLYYLRERITHKNIEIKYLVATNIYEWFIFDATLFDRQFAQNKNLVSQFNDFEDGRLADIKTDFFYKQVAEPFIAALNHSMEFTWFDIREYEKPLRNHDPKDDNKLIALFKLLSPEHLLKLPFVNDSNSLDKRFYSELLHIIGLTETKEGSKKVIGRSTTGQRNKGSFLENAINQLDSLDKISRLQNPSQYGANTEERLFNVGLELSITWINRILFLKLLEAQLISYHKDDSSFAFLNYKKIKDYDDLNSLFFQVLARKQNDRNDELRSLFSKVPYLNSSLFEPTDMEHATLFISNLSDDFTLPVCNATVLKDSAGKKRTGNLHPLQYLFEFLDAYDFTSEGSEEIQEENKTLINASVLGLIFEKINGYKDGSFFTPGFITMYMCRETIRRAVVQKFNEVKGWNCADLGALYDKIEDKKEANRIINSLKICDPAVGSGHFLVSALNELIALKNDLKILQDRHGLRLKEYQFEVVNDELIVTDEDGELFEYNPANKESQRVQEALFYEKQTIIENCLFGVDINPNSVKICRLRLWIELLKNAYYKNEDELETLPNIDINIKCGNSLISRFALDADLKQALKKSASKYTIDSYRIAVSTYRNASGKEEKHMMEKLIDEIKSNFRSEIAANDPLLKKLQNKKVELFNHTNQKQLFALSAKEKAAWNKKLSGLTADIAKIENEIEQIRNNKIYENAFEWRFEFPEVLDDNGDFIGFDVVIGNPPYGVSLTKSEDNFFRSSYFVSNYQLDTYIIFVELGINILKENGQLVFITPCTWYASIYDIKFRRWLLDNNYIHALTNCPRNTFEEAVVETSIIHLSKCKNINQLIIFDLDNQIINTIDKEQIISQSDYCFYISASSNEHKLISRIKNQYSTVNDYFEVIWGIKVYEKGKGFPPQNGSESIEKVFHSDIKIDENYKPLLGGSEIYPYKILWNGKFIKYGIWIAAPRKPEWFEATPRIVVREITTKGKIHAAYIADEFVFSNSVDGIWSRTGNMEQMIQLLGILNSKFASFFHIKSSSNSQKVSFPKLLIQNIRDFPFPSKIEKSLVQKVNHIIDIKKVDFARETKDIENEIDQLVYQLYDLTPEEIAIVEGAVK